jgi:hypothetical protein
MTGVRLSSGGRQSTVLQDTARIIAVLLKPMCVTARAAQTFPVDHMSDRFDATPLVMAE